MKLPNGGKADLGRKLEDYSLNSFHRQGKHKARLFESVLGITVENKHLLAAALMKAAENSTEAVAFENNEFGETYSLRFKLVTEKGVATVMSGWMIRRNENFPRLITCYIIP